MPDRRPRLFRGFHAVGLAELSCRLHSATCILLEIVVEATRFGKSICVVARVSEKCLVGAGSLSRSFLYIPR